MTLRTRAVAARPSRTAFAAALAVLAAALWGSGMAWRAWIVSVNGVICSAHGHGLLSLHCPLCYAAEAAAAAALVVGASGLLRSRAA